MFRSIIFLIKKMYSLIPSSLKNKSNESQIQNQVQNHNSNILNSCIESMVIKMIENSIMNAIDNKLKNNEDKKEEDNKEDKKEEEKEEEKENKNENILDKLINKELINNSKKFSFHLHKDDYLSYYCDNVIDNLCKEHIEKYDWKVLTNEKRLEWKIESDKLIFKKYQKYIFTELINELKFYTPLKHIYLKTFTTSNSKKGSNSLIYFFKGTILDDDFCEEEYCIKFCWVNEIYEFINECEMFKKFHPNLLLGYNILPIFLENKLLDGEKNIPNLKLCLGFPWILTKKIKEFNYNCYQNIFLHHPIPFHLLFLWVQNLKKCYKLDIFHGDIGLKNCIISNYNLPYDSTVYYEMFLIDFGLSRKLSEPFFLNKQYLKDDYKNVNLYWEPIKTSFHTMYPRSTGKIYKNCPYDISKFYLLDAWGFLSNFIDIWLKGSWFNFIKLKPMFSYDDPYVSILSGYSFATFLNISQEKYMKCILQYYEIDEHLKIVEYISSFKIKIHTSFFQFILTICEYQSELFENLKEIIHTLFFDLLEAKKDWILDQEKLYLKFEEIIYIVQNKVEEHFKKEKNKIEI